MSVSKVPHMQSELFKTGADSIGRIHDRSIGDAAFRRLLETDGRAALAEMGIAFPDGVAVKVVFNTDDRFYLAMPFVPDEGLGDEPLAGVVGGGGTTAGTAGSISTYACFAGCASTFASVGSAATAGPS